MCGPAAAPIMMGVSMAMMAAGTAAQQKAQADAQAAKNSANKQEALRQAGFENNANSLFTNDLARFQNNKPQDDLAAAVDRRMAGYDTALTPASPLAGTYSPGQNDAPQVVQTELGNAKAGSSARAQQTAGARASLNSMGDFLLNNSIASNRTAQQLGLNAGARTRSLNILPLELGRANNRGYSPLGDALVGFGQVVGSSAGSFGGSTAPAKGAKLPPPHGRPVASATRWGIP